MLVQNSVVVDACSLVIGMLYGGVANGNSCSIGRIHLQFGSSSRMLHATVMADMILIPCQMIFA